MPCKSEEEESSDDDVGVQYRPEPVMRRMGLPARVLVQREGDVYILSRNAGKEGIDAVLWFRRQALWAHYLPQHAILPYRVHSEALKHFKNWFMYSNLARRAFESCKKFAGKSHTYESHTLPQRGGTPSRSAGEWRYDRPLRQTSRRSAGYWRYGRSLADSVSRVDGSGVMVHPLPNLLLRKTPSRSAGEWRYGRPLRQTPRRSAGYWCYGSIFAESFSRVDESGVTVDPLPNGVTVDPLQRRGMVLRQTSEAEPLPQRSRDPPCPCWVFIPCKARGR